MRSCDEEVAEPIKGHVIGTIPKWIKGSLLRNGPGRLKVGEMMFKHLFDSSALVHRQILIQQCRVSSKKIYIFFSRKFVFRFYIHDGEVTYQCRFIQTETFKKNMVAKRIVVTEFGTSSVPDPCHNIFQRFSSRFKTSEKSDNTMISIYPFGDEYYTFTESPVIHK